MLIGIKNNHTLDDTLKEIVRLSNTYKNDVVSYIEMKPTEFFNFVAKKIKYEADPEGMELVMRPAITLKRGKGDCDDKTILCLSYFLLKKIPCGYSIVSSSNEKPFHHIFPFVIIKGKFFDFDATYPENFVGNMRTWVKRKNFIVKNEGA